MKIRPEVVGLLKTATAVFVVYFVVYSVFVIAFLSVYTDYSQESQESLIIDQRRVVRLNSSLKKGSVVGKKQRYFTDFESTLSQLAPNFGSLKQDCYFDLDHCFDLYKCVNYDSDPAKGSGDIEHISRLKVHIYEPGGSSLAAQGSFSAEFIEFIQAVANSRYYEPDPSKACLFVPLVDFLNENQLDPAKVDSYLKR